MKRKNKSQTRILVFFTLLLLTVFLQGRICTGAAEEEDKEEAFVSSSIEAPRCSLPAGFYEKTISLELAAPDGYYIFYTLDGSVPQTGNGESFRYDGPINLYCSEGELIKAAVLRYVSVTPTGERSDVVTNTYFVAKGMTTHYQVPVISLTIEPSDLYDSETGIFENPTESGREWERPAHLEYFLSDGAREISMNVGVRIHGGYSRNAKIKSMRIYARSEYDTQKNIKYDFFSDTLIPAEEKNGEMKTIKKFKRLIFRSGGNEGDAWEATFFRDYLVQSLMAGTRLDLQACRPSIMYLNGEFYGIINIRERQDERYLSSHYNASEEDFAVYGFEYDWDNNGKVIAPSSGDAFTTVMEIGSEDQLSFMQDAIRFVQENDLSKKENYEKAKQYFDEDNLIDYLCVQLYSGNTDWPHNNAKAYRYIGAPSEEYGLDGKIRWLLYDTDFGLGLYSHKADENTLSPMMKTSGRNQYRDVLSYLFRGFLQNPSFQKKFATRFMSLLETNFSSQELLRKIDLLTPIYSPLVPEVYTRYGSRMDYSISISIVQEYVKHRTGVMKGLVKMEFSDALNAPEEPEPTETPIEPTKAPTEPTKAPAEPTKAPAELTEAADPTKTPSELTEAPTKPTEAPSQEGEASKPVVKDEDIKEKGKENRIFFFSIFGVLLLAAGGIVFLLRKK